MMIRGEMISINIMVDMTTLKTEIDLIKITNCRDKVVIIMKTNLLGKIHMGDVVIVPVHVNETQHKIIMKVKERDEVENIVVDEGGVLGQGQGLEIPDLEMVPVHGNEKRSKIIMKAKEIEETNLGRAQGDIIAIIVRKGDMMNQVVKCLHQDETKKETTQGKKVEAHDTREAEVQALREAGKSYLTIFCPVHHNWRRKHNKELHN
jgi:hypothetical protein